ncbi:MAG: 4Fe-4S ferredoxin [Bacteroidetes bacterium HGW-Bacteroidetes-21]|jgi:polyferredoxin|nr:MAG: 4Fe-4S ferredoxin [Bacteroidetes bacterium HGW-Bacteroidetes-21]
MRKVKNIAIIFLLAIMAWQTTDVAAINRFPKPEFESGHTQPATVTPAPRAVFMEYLDVAVLIAALSLITWFILKKRSRKGVFWMSVFAILYFGFYREGCICSIGAIQNVALALFNEGYYIPVTAILFFVIPILYTLFFGRTFCAGVCPLGALQDIIAFKPMPVKAWLEKVLGIIPYIYLGLAVLYAATGTDFIICRYDPFVGFYRLDASFFMFVIGALFLLIGVFIARPYCRFLCPYGVILGLVSRFSFKHMTITPAECINCKLCEKSCPYGAINMPVPEKEKEKTEVLVKRYILLGILVPVLVFAGGLLLSSFHENLAMVNSKVKLASEILNNTNYGVVGREAIEITAFKSTGQSVEELYSEAANIVDQFYMGSWFLGGFIGLVFGLTLIGLTVFKFHTDYSPNKATCHSCARCMGYCPVKPEKK